MGRQLGRFLKTMGAASGVVPAMVASTGGPPSSGGSTREALIRWVTVQAQAAMAARVGSKFALGACYL
jgi:hypothetical protein